MSVAILTALASTAKQACKQRPPEIKTLEQKLKQASLSLKENPHQDKFSNEQKLVKPN